MVDYLDPEIANEGFSADGWAPALEAPRIPGAEIYKGRKATAADGSKKLLDEYFPQLSGRPYQHKAFPAYFYHPDGRSVLVTDQWGHDGEGNRVVVKKAQNWAKGLGCVWRATTMEERARGFPQHVWEYTGEWRATPFKTAFDPAKPDTGKHVVASNQPQAQLSQAELISATVAAVLAAMEARNPAPIAQPAPAPAGADNALHEAAAADKAALIARAEELGIEIDRRWGADRLKTEIERASA